MHVLIISSIVVFGVFLEGRAIQEWAIRKTLKETGMIADGTILLKQEKEENGSHFYVYYIFYVKTSDGENSPKFAEEEVSGQQYRSLQVGKSIVVRIDPDSPDIFRSDLNEKIYWLYAGFGGFCFILSAIWIFAYRLTNYKFQTIFHRRD